MQITYIGHSGFLAELPRTCLLFDYYEGTLPPFSPEKNLFVFSSHRHPDHFNPEIFRLAGEKTFFVLSDDIWERRIPEALRERTLRPHWNETHVFHGLDIQTLKSTDEGVAFLVRAEGKTIYHAGDLNDWHWPGEADSWNKQMRINFEQSMEPLRNTRIDASFVPLDPRQGEAYTRGLDYFLSLTHPEKSGSRIYPMHCWEEYAVIDRWLSEHPEHPARNCIVSIAKRGEVFEQ